MKKFLKAINASLIFSIQISNIAYSQNFNQVAKYLNFYGKNQVEPISTLNCDSLNIYSSNTVTVKALKLIGQKYQAGILDSDEEGCNPGGLNRFDCVTFIETIIALCYIEECYNNDLTKFDEIITSIRYRNGYVEGYGSRLHYFTDWIYDNEKKGYIQNITHCFKHECKNKEINFISNNKQKYKKLDEVSTKQIITTEKELSEKSLCYVPKRNVRDALQKIKDGNIIALTTNKPGLDVVHAGIIYTINGYKHLIHASSLSGKVEITKRSIESYINVRKDVNGILIIQLK